MEYKFLKMIIEIELKKEVEVISRFSGGMSNYTVLVKIDGKLYTYRIPGKNSSVFIDREVEYANLELIKNLELNCDNIYFNKVNGHKIAEYIEGEDLSSFSVDLNIVSELLLKLHNSGIVAVNDYDVIKRIDYYESLLKYPVSEQFSELKNKLPIMFKEFEKYPKVFCHGDAQKANWINSDRLYLLDWEYSGNNDPYYDIACFGNANFEDAIELLNCYLKRTPNNEEMRRLITNRMAQCLQWHNVALYKEQIGLSKELKVNFKEVSKKYVLKAKELYELYKKYE
ncbi:MAG: choline kinase family protein [bacterium]